MASARPLRLHLRSGRTDRCNHAEDTLLIEGWGAAQQALLAIGGRDGDCDGANGRRGGFAPGRLAIHYGPTVPTRRADASERIHGQEMPTVPRSTQSLLLALPTSLAALVAVTGCASQRAEIEPQPGQVKGLLPAEADARAEIVRRNPIAYLRRVAEKCHTLKQYTLTFTRYERRGLLQQLYGPERIACWFRRRPFSVHMKWLDNSTKYEESAYGEGQGENKVRFVTRYWTPPLLPPPTVNKVDLQTPVVFGESKRPMTDFGLERLMERTLDSIAAAGDDVVVTYEGLLQLPDGGPTVHHLHLEYSAARYKVPIQELYVDVASDLPAGTILKAASGDIDASYFYANVDTNVTLTDADFMLEAERAAAEKSPPGGATKK